MPEPTVRYEVKDGVATITLDRPRVLNALDERMPLALAEAAEAAARDRSVWVALVRGAGRAFCSGDDLKEFETQLQDAARIPTFAAEPSGPSPKASALMNSAMGKPMPPSSDTPAIWMKRVPAGSWPTPRFNASQHAQSQS